MSEGQRGLCNLPKDTELRVSRARLWVHRGSGMCLHLPRYRCRDPLGFGVRVLGVKDKDKKGIEIREPIIIWLVIFSRKSRHPPLSCSCYH